MSEPIRVLLVEDDTRVRGIAAASLQERGLQVVESANAREALAQVQSARPDVAVVDLGLPDLDGVELIQMLRTRRPTTPVIVLTVATSEARVLAALRAGAVGYLFKEDLVRRLPNAIVEAFEGGAPMSPAVAQLVLAQVRAPRAPEPADEGALTQRERDVLDAVGRGLTYEEAAAVLNISINTVRSHIRVIYGKLDATTKTEAVVAALRRGLLTA